MCLHLDHRRARALLFGEHNAAAASEHTVATAHGVLWHGDIDKEERLLENRLRQQQRREHYATRGWHDLTHAAMYRVGMKRYVKELERNTTHLLVTEDRRLGRPLEAGNNRLADLTKIVYTLSLVVQEIGTGPVRPKAPDLACIANIPAVFVGHEARTEFGVVLGRDLACLDGIRKLVGEGCRLHVEPIMFVRRLGKARLRRVCGARLAV